MNDRASLERGVAVIGIGCRFPGGANDVAGFWRLLRDGVDAIGPIPSERIDVDHYFDARPGTPGRMMTRWGGFLDDVEGFDPEFFGVSPREAERIDPQQRLLLETAWEALEDAGQDAQALNGRPVGVFVGQWLSDFESRLCADPSGMEFDMTTGSGRYAASGRVSYALGLRGPSLTLDTGCSSSLVAVHLAARSVRSGESTIALAGGVNVILQPHISIAYSQSGMMAADGRCKFGDARGDGYVRSEGAGLVVLKRLDRALADGDRIYAVIRGTATNNDGRSSGSMGTPSRVGQEELLRSALHDAGVVGGEVGYVEAHGTGTRAGDPVEIGALAAVLDEGRPGGVRCLIGSVKTNIGHTEGAAGVAGLIKAVLALHHGDIPPTLNVRERTPAVPWNDVPVELALGRTPWPRGDRPRFAGVNSFGIAGTNAHVVLQEAPPPARAVAPAGARESALPLSARSAPALAALVARHADALEADPEAVLADWCATAGRRAAHDVRTCIVAPDRPTMIEALRQFDGAAAASNPTARPRLAFVVPGQGAQSIGMARELMRTEPVFRAAIQACDAAARTVVDWSIEAQLDADAAIAGASSDRIDVLQPVLVSLAIAYAALLRSWGVEPGMVVGHSMGEVGAACIAGAIDVGQAMRIVCRRSALMRRASGQGAMALVELPSRELAERLAGTDGRVTIAVVNSPRSCVVAGAPDAVQRLTDALEREGVFCRRVNVDVASHSPQMDPLADELRRDLAGLSPGTTTCALYSSVLARRVEGGELGPDYWARNLREPVRFGDAVQAMLDDGATCFVELGPHPVLLPAVEQNARPGGPPLTTAACGRRGEPDRQVMLRAVGALWTAGLPIDWPRILAVGGRADGLPAYPWQRRRHWAAAAERPVSGGAAGGRRLPRPDDETLETLHGLQWVRREVGTRPDAAAPACWLVAADDADAAGALRDALTRTGAQATAVGLDRWRDALDERGADHVVLIAADGPETAYLPVAAARSLLRARPAKPPKLWLLTRGGQAVGAGERVSVDQAAAWGAARVVGAEHPELHGGSIDLPASTAAFAGWDLAARHLATYDGEDQVALRDDDRFVLRLQPASGRTTAPLALRADASYLITGGLGGIGLHLARALIAAGARRLVLLQRAALPPREAWAALDARDPDARRVAAVRELEALGAAIHPEAVDVGDEAALRALLARHAREAWPPIRGVVHAAGVFDNRLVTDMDAAAFEVAARAKLGGARLLDRLFPELDLFVLISSTGAFLPQAGQANYAAANAGLDALAHDRRAREQPALSIGWGVWADTGLVDDAAGRRNVAEMKRQGIGALSPETARGLFPWLCVRPEAHLAVLPIDWAVHAAARRGRLPRLFADFVDAAGSEVAPVDAGADAADRGGRPDAPATPAARRTALRTAVREAVGKVLKMPAPRVDPEKAFGAMGLNSLMAMELRNRLETLVGRPLSATLAWNYPTVAALAEHLADVDAPPAAEPARPAAVASGEAALVGELSDAEAAMALRGRGRRGGA